MNGIIINEKNRDRINEAIREAEGRATVRLLTYDDLADAVARLERHLGIAKKNMIDITADIDVNCQTFPHAYRYSPESTRAEVVRTSSGWKLVKAYRGETRTYGHEFEVSLTDTAKKAIIESMEDF